MSSGNCAVCDTSNCDLLLVYHKYDNEPSFYCRECYQEYVNNEEVGKDSGYVYTIL